MKALQELDKYHSLQPYFDLITAHMHQLINGTSKKSILLNSGTSSKSPNSPKRGSFIQKMLGLNLPAEEEG